MPALLAWMDQETSTEVGRSHMETLILMESQPSPQGANHIPRLASSFEKEPQEGLYF